MALPKCKNHPMLTGEDSYVLPVGFPNYKCKTLCQDYPVIIKEELACECRK